jgi:hypothetical protein
MEIKRYYDIITEQEDFKTIIKILTNRNWVIQSSNIDDTNNFFMSNLFDDEINFYLQKFDSVLSMYAKNNGIQETLFIERAYINCHPCYHPGNWHVDNLTGFTLLYYPETETDFGDEGGTDFKNFNFEKYIPNSILIFPADELHMATEHSQKGKFRYSIAFKFRL